MGIIKKPGAKPAPKAAPAPVEEETSIIGRTVTLSRGYTVQTGEGQYAKASVSVSGSIDEIDEIREQVSELASNEIATAVEQIREFSWDGGYEGAGGATNEAGDEDPDVATSDEEDIGPEQVMLMDRATLETLIEGNELDIDPATFPKNPGGLKKLREAVVAAAFDGSEGEAEDDTAEGTAEAEDGGEISVEDIQAMTRPQLVELITENEIDVDPAKHPKLQALKDAVIAVLSAEDDGEATEGDEADETEAEAEAYTRESLSAMTLADLKAIYADWDLGKFPAGAPPAAKKAAITAILKAQQG